MLLLPPSSTRCKHEASRPCQCEASALAQPQHLPPTIMLAFLTHQQCQLLAVILPVRAHAWRTRMVPPCMVAPRPTRARACSSSARPPEVRFPQTNLAVVGANISSLIGGPPPSPPWGTKVTLQKGQWQRPVTHCLAPSSITAGLCVWQPQRGTPVMIAAMTWPACTSWLDAQKSSGETAHLPLRVPICSMLGCK